MTIAHIIRNHGESSSGGETPTTLEADWQARSRASGVFYANDFSTFADDEELQDSNYGGTASQYEAGTTLETRSGIYGKVCRLHIFKTANEGTPSYRHSWDGVGAQTKATVKKRFFYQWQMYIPAYVLDHRFRTDASNPPDEPADLTSSVSHKFVIFQEPDVSFASGEVVVTNRGFRGFVTAYRHNGDTTLNFADSISGLPGGGSPDYRWQPAIDSGESVSNNADARRRYGPLQYSFPGGIEYGTPLSEQGTPDEEASVNGVPWAPDAINVVEVEIDADEDTFRLWHAVRGEAPTLLAEYVGNADIGTRTDNYTGPQLLPRLEQLIADATREDTYVDYGELIASDDPIDFPGGFTPAGSSALAQAAAQLSAGESIKLNTTLAGSVLEAGDGADFLQWGSSGYWNPTDREAGWIGKRHSTFPYRWLVYDEVTNTWSSDREPWDTDNHSGHGYDHTTYDAANNRVLNRPYNNTNIYGYSGGEWSVYTTQPRSNGSYMDAGTITFFPSVGLVYSDEGCIEIFNGSSWNQLETFSIGSNANHTASQYNATANAMIFGGGNTGVAMRKMTSDLTISSIATPPFNVGSSSTQGVLIDDPSSAKFIALEKGTTNWAEYDIDADEWNELTQSSGDGSSPQNGLPNLNSGTSNSASCIAISIATYGVIMFIQFVSGSTNANVWLYRHS